MQKIKYNSFVIEHNIKYNSYVFIYKRNVIQIDFLVDSGYYLKSPWALVAKKRK